MNQLELAPSQNDETAGAGADEGDQLAEVARYLERLLNEGQERMEGDVCTICYISLRWISIHGKTCENQCLLHEEGVQWLHSGGSED